MPQSDNKPSSQEQPSASSKPHEVKPMAARPVNQTPPEIIGQGGIIQCSEPKDYLSVRAKSSDN
jgi:hypothetical protein